MRLSGCFSSQKRKKNERTWNRIPYLKALRRIKLHQLDTCLGFDEGSRFDKNRRHESFFLLILTDVPARAYSHLKIAAN